MTSRPVAHRMPFRCPYGDYLSTWIRTPVEEDLEFFVERERERKGEGESFSGGVQSVGDARNKKKDLRRNWKWNFFSFKPSSVRSFNMYLFDDIRLGLASFLEEEHGYLIDYQFKETSILF